MTLSPRANYLLFEVYPYVCLTVLLLGSLIRYDREPYSWKSDSSEVLRLRQLRFGSNMFHYGVLIVIIGHFVGFLLPEKLVYLLVSPTEHELTAMIVGGIAGLCALIGLTVIIWRRLRYRPIRANSRKWDITIVFMLWFQLALGLTTIWFSAQTLAGGGFEKLVQYVQSIVYFKGGGAALIAGVPWVYKAHILLGFTIFLVSPFTRMIHIWSGVGSLAYLVRPYQLVRKDTRSANPMK